MHSAFIRPCIRKMVAYTPGEQPRVPGLIKLNTNENPYPPSPRVFQAIRRELDGRLRLYPDPLSERLRRKAAAVYGFRPDQVIAGNGSDEILTLCLRAFVDEGRLVQFPVPSYSLYPVLTQIQNARIRRIAFTPRFGLDLAAFDRRAALTFIASPNAPSGTAIPPAFLRKLSVKLHGVLVIDEAYADFAGHHALGLARRARNVLVTRSFSKSFALAGMRIGLAFGGRELVGALFKVKDSYNLDRLTQVTAEAALSDLTYHRRTVARVKRTREWFRTKLEQLGWRVFPSEANFVFARPPGRSAREWFLRLRNRGILVRWFDHASTRDYLRISIGTDSEMKRLAAVAGSPEHS